MKNSRSPHPEEPRSGVLKDEARTHGKRYASPLPGGRGAGVRVCGYSSEALTPPLTTACALFGEGLPSPLTLFQTGEGDMSRFRAPWIILRDGHFVASSG
jgi:hypothetical protein